jgi:membrane protein implicated in regulation of membrane protease activity
MKWQSRTGLPITLNLTVAAFVAGAIWILRDSPWWAILLWSLMAAVFLNRAIQAYRRMKSEGAGGRETAGEERHAG